MVLGACMQVRTHFTFMSKAQSTKTTLSTQRSYVWNAVCDTQRLVAAAIGYSRRIRQTHRITSSYP